jgi:hypothetical protein
MELLGDQLKSILLYLTVRTLVLHILLLSSPQIPNPLFGTRNANL